MQGETRSPLDNARSFMTRGPEKVIATYFAGVFLALGSALAVGQGVVYALFLKRYGIDYLPIMYLILGFVMAPAALVYFAVINKYPSERILNAGLTLVGLLLLCSWAWLHIYGSEAVYPTLFIIYEVVTEWLMIHTGLYLSQNFDTSQLKRIGPMLFGAWQTGIIAGGFLLAVTGPILGLPQMTLVWLALFSAAMLLIARHHRIHGVSRFSRTSGKGRFALDTTIGEIRQGLSIMWSAALVRAAALAMFFLVISIYILIYLVNRVYTSHFADEARLGSFLGWLILFSGCFTLFLQFFLTSRIIQRLGVAKTNAILPTALFGSFVALGISFSLPSAILGTLCKDVLLPGIHRPSRNVLLNAVPSSIQASMRALLLVLVVPMALISGGILLFSAQYVDLPLVFVALGLVVSGYLAWFTWRANRAYPDSLLDALRQQVVVPDNRRKDATVAATPETDRYTLMGDVKAKIAHAQLLHQAVSTVTGAGDSTTNPSSGLRLLNIVLAERLEEAIRESLNALAKIEDPSAIEVIYAGVNSSEPQSRALACEALHNLRNKKLAKAITDLLDKNHAEGKHQDKDSEQLGDLDDVIKWCTQHTDPWLRQCADFALSHTTSESVQDGDTLGRILMLKTTPIFQEVNTLDLRDVARELVEVTFHSGQRVFDINDPSDRFFIVERGKIGISTHPDPRTQDFITTLGPGASMGEMGCFEHRLRSATAHVLEDSVLLALEKEKLRGLILQHPQLSLGLLRGLGARLRKVTSESGTVNAE